MMRHLFVLLLSLSSLGLLAQTKEQAPTAEAILQPTLAKAKEGGKNVLLLFHASWCGWCRKMDASLADKTIQPLIAKNYEIAHLTVYESQNKKYLENKGALEFLQENGGAEKGLPFWYVLNSEGKVLASSEISQGNNSGCPATEEEVAYFLSVLKKTARLTDAELETIRVRFRQNEK
ncbi:MAG: thioredoxin family protein [Chitinophagaceae bacterium]|nr:MAG: thioredoxin family protein [Chitinophagaceae bacterium]